ncbi:unnamed protein product [Rhizophagus irregularis]|nr:unnamed protein product [Rhizophagus irregularis]
MASNKKNEISIEMYDDKDDKALECFKKAEKESKNATEWIENARKHRQVKFIPHNELENIEPIGKGGFGHIMRAIWIKTHDYVICKRLTNTADIKNNLLDAFIHELKIHYIHANYSRRIIRCLGISLDPKENDYLLIMQYANGGDLRNHLKDNFENLTWGDKKNLAFQIADGLNYLHNEGILHRDLHSKNILIHEHNAKITDFGISKIQNDQNSTVYTGNFDSNNDIALAFDINEGVREATIPDTPKEYEELYKTCWDKDPKQRPTINEVLNKFEKMGFGINARDKPIKENNENLTSDEWQTCNDSLEII